MLLGTNQGFWKRFFFFSRPFKILKIVWSKYLEFNNCESKTVVLTLKSCWAVALKISGKKITASKARWSSVQPKKQKKKAMTDQLTICQQTDVTRHQELEINISLIFQGFLTFLPWWFIDDEFTSRSNPSCAASVPEPSTLLHPWKATSQCILQPKDTDARYFFALWNFV